MRDQAAAGLAVGFDGWCRLGIRAGLVPLEAGFAGLGRAASPLQATTAIAGRPPLASKAGRQGRDLMTLFKPNLAGKKVAL